MRPDGDRVGEAGEAFADERLAAELAGLRPAAAAPALRSRIEAVLAAAPARPRGLAIAERLAWAAAGAVAASLVITLGSGKPAGDPPAAVSPQAALLAAARPMEPTEPREPAAARDPAAVGRVTEQEFGWSDEGIRFLDALTPARILRRRVVERHVAADGRAEVQVPREDLIFLPVALR